MTRRPDVLVEQLAAPAKKISRERPFDIDMDSCDQSIDGIVAVGMHAGAASEAGMILGDGRLSRLQGSPGSGPG